MTDTPDNQPIPAPAGSEIPPRPANVPDVDRDGIPAAWVDEDGPGPKPGRYRDVRIIVDPRTGRKRKVADLGWADDDKPDPIDKALRDREGFFERMGRKADAAMRVWRATAAVSLVSLLACLFYIVGIWNGLFGVAYPAITETEIHVIEAFEKSTKWNEGSGSWIDGLKDGRDGGPDEAGALFECLTIDQRRREGED